MSGNIPSFLKVDEPKASFRQVAELLNHGGIFVLGMTTDFQGGPKAHDKAVAGTGGT